MDQDEEEEDFAEEEEEEEEEEEDIYNKDKKKIFGDTNHYCPVMLKEKFVLWPGIAECAAKYRERTYFFSSPESRGVFLDDPESFLPSNRPLVEVRNFTNYKWLLICIWFVAITTNAKAHMLFLIELLFIQSIASPDSSFDRWSQRSR